MCCTAPGPAGKVTALSKKATTRLLLRCLALAHLQLVLGLVQYFGFSAYVNFSDMAATMKNPITRYFSVEHITIMILAIAAVQVGRTLSKKAADDTEKHKKLAIWTTIAAVLVVVGLSMKGLLFGTVAGMNAAM
jgi:uncharacterized membrane protein YidH (DUF202 family)